MAELRHSKGDVVTVEVAWASRDEQSLIETQVEAGATVEAAIRASGIYDRHPGRGLEDAAVGIWGKPVSRDTRVEAGNRIELYRPLLLDPRETRRKLAEIGLTMREGAGD